MVFFFHINSMSFIFRQELYFTYKIKIFRGPTKNVEENALNDVLLFFQIILVPLKLTM